MRLGKKCEENTCVSEEASHVADEEILRLYRSIFEKIRRPFAKFVDSPYYFESDVHGGAMTVSFSKYLPWQAMQFSQRSTHFSKTCHRPLITSKFLASELPFHV
jgi:hypothetical protein